LDKSEREEEDKVVFMHVSLYAKEEEVKSHLEMKH
jgi:hypothetical protein